MEVVLVILTTFSVGAILGYWLGNKRLLKSSGAGGWRHQLRRP